MIYHVMYSVANTTDKIITDILDPFNACQQSITRYQVCLENKNHPYASLVSSNTISNWEKYFREDRSRLYSKGYETRKDILRMVSSNEYDMLSATEQWFVLAGLIILFQMYGDGNHRTAYYLYKKCTGLNLALDDINKIQYEYRINEVDIFGMLLSIYHKHINVI